jgi:hypothetical protein
MKKAAPGGFFEVMPLAEKFETFRPLAMSRMSTMTKALRLVMFCCVFIMAHLFPAWIAVL